MATTNRPTIVDLTDQLDGDDHEGRDFVTGRSAQKASPTPTGLFAKRFGHSPIRTHAPKPSDASPAKVATTSPPKKRVPKSFNAATNGHHKLGAGSKSSPVGVDASGSRTSAKKSPNMEMPNYVLPRLAKKTPIEIGDSSPPPRFQKPRGLPESSEPHASRNGAHGPTRHTVGSSGKPKRPREDEPANHPSGPTRKRPRLSGDASNEHSTARAASQTRSQDVRNAHGHGRRMVTVARRGAHSVIDLTWSAGEESSTEHRKPRKISGRTAGFASRLPSSRNGYDVSARSAQGASVRDVASDANVAHKTRHGRGMVHNTIDGATQDWRHTHQSGQNGLTGGPESDVPAPGVTSRDSPAQSGGASLKSPSRYDAQRSSRSPGKLTSRSRDRDTAASRAPVHVSHDRHSPRTRESAGVDLGHRLTWPASTSPARSDAYELQEGKAPALQSKPGQESDRNSASTPDLTATADEQQETNHVIATSEVLPNLTKSPDPHEDPAEKHVQPPHEEHRSSLGLLMRILNKGLPGRRNRLEKTAEPPSLRADPPKELPDLQGDAIMPAAVEAPAQATQPPIAEGEAARSNTSPPTDSIFNGLGAGQEKERDSGVAAPIVTRFGTKLKSRQMAYPNLSTSNQVELVLDSRYAELREDNEYWTRIRLQRMRLSVSPVQSSRREKPTSVFRRLVPLRPKVAERKSTDHAHARLMFDTFTGKGTKVVWTVPIRRFKTPKSRDVPNYSHYVSISNNILAPNVTTLQHWPYFGDEFDLRDALGLKEQYFLDMNDRPRKLKRLLQAELFAEYVEAMLSELSCAWPDVLRFLLEGSPDVGRDPDALKALSNRESFCQEDFDRTNERWTSLLSRLPASEPAMIGTAALLCAHFQRKVKFPLWHVARRSAYVTDRLQDEEKDDDNESPDEDELTCRICLRFNCPYHGEIEDIQVYEGGANPSENQEDVAETDIVHPPNVNSRLRVGMPPSIDAEEASATRRVWNPKDYTHQPDVRGPFYPCHHPGQSCAESHCSCFETNIPCEKMCSCPASCPRKFRGCSCASHAEKGKRSGKSVCFEDERCICFQLGRECDPDLCGGCGVCEVLDPQYRDDDRILEGRCRNASIQRGVPKHTMLGESGIHGLGLYTCENINEHEFVGEYKGEIITKEEAERRGAVYEHQKLSYLFSLNADQEIDSTYFGNKMRFVNHAAKARANLYPRIIMVNMVHRIAMYGARRIQTGEELFFDYGPKFPDDQLGGKKAKRSIGQNKDVEDAAKKSIPHVRNANITKSFYDVEEQRDELGRARMRKAVTGTSPRKAKSTARASPLPQEPVQPKPRGTRKAVTIADLDDDNTAMEDAEARLQYYVHEDVASDHMDLDGDGEQEWAADAEDSDDAFEPMDADEAASSSEREGFDEEEVPRRQGRPRKHFSDF